MASASPSFFPLHSFILIGPFPHVENAPSSLLPFFNKNNPVSSSSSVWAYLRLWYFRIQLQTPCFIHLASSFSMSPCVSVNTKSIWAAENLCPGGGPIWSEGGPTGIKRAGLLFPLGVRIKAP